MKHEKFRACVLAAAIIIPAMLFSACSSAPESSYEQTKPSAAVTTQAATTAAAPETEAASTASEKKETKPQNSKPKKVNAKLNKVDGGIIKVKSIKAGEDKLETSARTVEGIKVELEYEIVDKGLKKKGVDSFVISVLDSNKKPAFNNMASKADSKSLYTFFPSDIKSGDYIIKFDMSSDVKENVSYIYITLTNG
ncbi:MAG TPA: hypothetical protein DEO32_00695 [Ruminococcaceae bacterium]|nr:hypothetical protein [Oscillospiraceae bacterium]